MQKLIPLSILSPAVASSNHWWRNVTPQAHRVPSPEYSPKPQMCGWGTCQWNQNSFPSLINFSICLWSFTTSSGEKLYRLNRLRVKNYFSFSSWFASFSCCLPVLLEGKRVNSHSLFAFFSPFCLYHFLLNNFFSRDKKTVTETVPYTGTVLGFVGGWLKY